MGAAEGQDSSAVTWSRSKSVLTTNPEFSVPKNHKNISQTTPARQSRAIESVEVEIRWEHSLATSQEEESWRWVTRGRGRGYKTPKPRPLTRALEVRKRGKSLPQSTLPSTNGRIAVPDMLLRMLRSRSKFLKHSFVLCDLQSRG